MNELGKCLMKRLKRMKQVFELCEADETFMKQVPETGAANCKASGSSV